MTAAAPDARRLGLALAGLAVAVTAVCSLGIGVRSTYGGRAAVDEPEYLLTAISLGEDGDLDIADELRERRWRAFHDRELPVQTAVRDDGRRISPHDPLLPLLLALPMRWGGFVAAKATVAVLAGALAALTCWVAVRRLDVPLAVAVTVVGLLSVAPPLGVYATQVYPELPAALVVMVGVAVLTGPLGRRTSVWAVGSAVTALPWLSVKYAAVAAALAGVALWRLRTRGSRRAAGWLAGGLGAMGAAYVVVHRLVYGGFTSYASGDHFERSGELTVVGSSPNGAGRATRLVGLLVDRGFGIVPWQPLWLLAVPAVVSVLAARRRWRWPVLLPLAAGWLTASFVALTAHGYWSPGRQVVVVLPLASLALCSAVARTGRRGLLLVGLAGAIGVVNLGWLLVDGWALELTWVTAFEQVDSPAYRALRPLLPDYREPGTATWLLHALWVAALASAAVLAWRAARPAGAPSAGRRIRVGLVAGAVALAACGGVTDDGSDIRDDDGHQDATESASR